MNSRSSVAVGVLALLLAGTAGAQSNIETGPAMPREMLVGIQSFLSTKIGGDLAEIDPSIGAIQDMDPDYHSHRKALAEMAEDLSKDKHFDLKAQDHDAKESAAIAILEANRKAKNSARVSEILRDKFKELQGGGSSRDELRKEAEKLSPLVRYAIGLNSAELKETMKRARAAADSLGMALKFGFPDDSPVSKDGPQGVEWQSPLSIHPGQMVAGQIEVDMRAARFKMMGSEEKKKYLLENPIKVAVDEDGKYHHGDETNDHHHLLKAAFEAGIEAIAVEKSKPGSGSDDGKTVYLYDQNGKKHSIDDLPRTVEGLVDFPERSLAWMVRKFRGFKKTDIPFAEMDWAQFFRTHLTTSAKLDFYGALREALKIARSSAARHLPGYGQ